ncbi:MAG: cation:proton antiporter [Candidatus Thermoplasmatota archaeon]|nr:cation:proton antiporter [Candidatus Thermoplasmatota archaeon]
MAIVVAVAALIIVLFNRFRQPLILGYLVAGMVVGPVVTSAEFSLTVADETIIISAHPVIEMLARLGIVLLTFSIGLEFSFKQLRKIGIAVIAAASMEIFLMIGIGFQLGKALGWTTLESSLLGAVLSVASTMIIVRSLRESGGLSNEKARLVIGLLVVEDFAAVLILAAVSGLIYQGSVSPEALTELLVKMGIFIAATLVFGLAVVPRLVNYVGRQRSGELMVLTVLGLCFSMAAFSRWIGFSEAIGAFVMGVIVSESKYLGDVIRRVEPVRDLFGAMFFIAVGMLVDPELFLRTGFLATALVITAVFVLAKIFSCTLATFVFGFGARNAIGAGLRMIAIGEFSLMIAAVAIGSPGISENINLYSTIVVVTTITALVVPYSVRYSEKTTRRLELSTPKPVLLMTTYLNLVFRNLRMRSRTSLRLSNEMRDSISRLFIYVIAMVSAIAVAANLVPRASDYAYLVGGNEGLLMFVLLTGTIIVVEASVFGIWSRTVRLIEISTSEAMLSTKSAERIGYQDTAKAMKWVFLAFYLIVGLIVVSPLLRSLVEHGLVFAIMSIAIIAIAVATLWSSISTLDKKMGRMFEGRAASVHGEPSPDLIEIEDIMTTMERDRD